MVVVSMLRSLFVNYNYVCQLQFAHKFPYYYYSSGNKSLRDEEK